MFETIRAYLTNFEGIRKAKDCIKIQKRLGTFNNTEIGVIVKKIQHFVSYNKGDVVLIRDFDKKDKTYTVESPLCEELMDRPGSGSRDLLTTFKTILGVPKNYVRGLAF